MSIITLMIVIALAIVILWAVNTYLPDQPPLRLILNVIVIIVLLVVLLSIAGVLPDLGRPISR